MATEVALHSLKQYPCESFNLLILVTRVFLARNLKVVHKIGYHKNCRRSILKGRP